MSDMNNSRDMNLEPRVAKLEVGLDRLTEDVRSLASIVRDQGSNVEKQLNDLTVAVTQAAGPRKTDWSVIISAVLLVMAIGSAAFWPLNQTAQENKNALEALNQSFQNHSQITMHPVGQAIVQRLEYQLKDHIDSNKQSMESHIADAKEMHQVINNNFSKQIEYIQKIHDLELAALKEKLSLQHDNLYERVVKLERTDETDTTLLKNELQKLRSSMMNVDKIN